MKGMVHIMTVWIVEDLTDNSIKAVCDNPEAALSLAILLELKQCGVNDLTLTIITELINSYRADPRSFGADEAWGIYTTELNMPIF